MCGKTKMKKVRNEDIHSLVRVTPIEDKMRENKLRGRPKMTWMEVVKKEMKLLELEKRMVVNRNDWRRRIHVLDRL